MAASYFGANWLCRPFFGISFGANFCAPRGQFRYFCRLVEGGLTVIPDIEIRQAREISSG